MKRVTNYNRYALQVTRYLFKSLNIKFLNLFLLFVFCFYPSDLVAQKDTTFYRHEVKGSCSDAILASIFLEPHGWFYYANVSVAYLYRPVKWFWVGGNIVFYVGNRIDYNWREYYPNGSFRDFSKSKINFCVVIAPEIRFSYLNKKRAVLYSALSGGVGLENGYDKRYVKYPNLVPYFHITYFGFSINFGKNYNIFLGGEGGSGFKGFVNFHGGYRF